MGRTATAMKQFSTRIAFLLLLTLYSPCGPLAAEMDNPPPAGAAPASQAPSPAAEDGNAPGNGEQPEERETFRHLKQRYRNDATGVRARLGMCRCEPAEPCGGRHRRHRGGGQWSTP